MIQVNSSTYAKIKDKHSQLDGGSSEVINIHWEGSVWRVSATLSSITVILRQVLFKSSYGQMAQTAMK